MIIKLLSGLFKMVIGNLSSEQKDILWNRFSALMSEVVKAGAAGMVEGAIKK